IDLLLDHRSRDHRLRARFEIDRPPGSLFTDTPFGWIERTSGSHPVSSIAVAFGAPQVALGGPGLHEIELDRDGALKLTLLRAVGVMSRSDLSTRPGHAGYQVPTPGAQGQRRLRFSYVVGFGDEGVQATARAIEPALVRPQVVPLAGATREGRAL